MARNKAAYVRPGRPTAMKSIRRRRLKNRAAAVLRATDGRFGMRVVPSARRYRRKVKHPKGFNSPVFGGLV